MKKLLTASAVTLAIACTSAAAMTGTPIPGMSSSGNLGGSNHASTLTTYFSVTLPDGMDFKITSGGQDLTGYMAGDSGTVWYGSFKPGTYVIQLNDSAKTAACTFNVGYWTANPQPKINGKVVSPFKVMNVNPGPGNAYKCMATKADNTGTYYPNEVKVTK